MYRSPTAKDSSSSLPTVLICSNVQFPHCPNAYGFPQGKVQRYYYPESNLCKKPRKSSRAKLAKTLTHFPRMPKKSTNAPPLQLGSSNFNNPPKTSPLSPDSLSPLSPDSIMSSPASAYQKSSTIRPLTGGSTVSSTTKAASLSPHSPRQPSHEEQDNSTADVPPTPGITAIPQYPPSPKDTKHQRDASKSFFGNLKASKSSNRIQPPDSRSVESRPVSRNSSNERATNTLSRGHNDSTSDIPSSASAVTKNNGKIILITYIIDDSPFELSTYIGGWFDDRSSRKGSIATQESELPYPLANKRSKPRFGNLLSRSRSIRVDEPFSSAKLPSASRRPSNGLLRLEGNAKESQPSLKTAPLQPERRFKEVMVSNGRTRSNDRQASDDSTSAKRERNYGGSVTASSSLSQVSTASLFNNIKQTSSGAADRLGKAGNRFFGKFTGSGNTIERETITDDSYVCSVINLPLVEQTRRTRISKRLENSKDKTEYWMPALPWRCIEYVFLSL